MNWISSVLGVAAGTLAALIAGLIVRNPKEKRGSYTVVLIIGFSVLNSLLKEFILPELNAIYEIKKAESSLQEMPAYQAIKKYDPAAYEALLGSLRSGLRNKATAAQITGQVRSHVTTLVQQRLPRSSDEAIVFYMGVMVQEMKELNKTGRRKISEEAAHEHAHLGTV